MGSPRGETILSGHHSPLKKARQRFRHLSVPYDQLHSIACAIQYTQEYPTIAMPPTLSGPPICFQGGYILPGYLPAPHGGLAAPHGGLAAPHGGLAPVVSAPGMLAIPSTTALNTTAAMTGGYYLSHDPTAMMQARGMISMATAPLSPMHAGRGLVGGAGGSPTAGLTLSMPGVVGTPVASCSPEPAHSPLQSGAGPTTGTTQAVYSMSVTTQMELIWHGEFDRLFAGSAPDCWTLRPALDFVPGDNFRQFMDSAKVRFHCQNCGRGWTSMKGRVTFWFHLDTASHTGDVYFKLYGQRCQKCGADGFEHAMWYPEEVIKVVGNLYSRVGQCYYGFGSPPLRIDRRTGRPRAQHDAKLCQACHDGICRAAFTAS